MNPIVADGEVSKVVLRVHRVEFNKRVTETGLGSFVTKRLNLS